MRAPAEWERHAATWLIWPHNRETWPGCLDAARREFAALVDALLECDETVELLAQTGELAGELRSRFAGRRVRVHAIATDDAWMRDIGPTFCPR